MADTATAATTAASKKKYRNKKKTQQPQKSEAKPAQGPVTVKAVVHQSNGHVESEANNEMSVINSLMEQVQLCNGHVIEGSKVTAASIGATVNGHVNKSAAINNNNHINNNNNSSNNNNDVSNINSSSRNRKNNNSSSSKAKNNNKAQVSIEDSESGEHDTSLAAAVATSNTSTANTHTTKTTAKITATDSIQDEAPSTSAAAGVGATVAQPQEQEEQPQLQLQLEPAISADEIVYKEYEAEHQMHDIMRLIQAELSEPYSIYTYRYFIYNWPKLCFLAAHDNQYVGAIVCKLDMHMNVRRGYIAMLAVRKEYRKLKIGTTLVTKAIEAMLADNADEVVLETEMRNEPALRLYENLGFVRDKRLFRYYLNGVDALRLKLWFR
ncbi:N-alpha-acetyltransferase 30A [Drosophila hydei]|uniref:N-terminal methionine N(alpha)-acetyltransferase NatC n=1 Tax=Drosophila hydei TaxID=7224 RepID=A0A6J1M128_DROHY|nr:N-alpha-acetyltransferase 30A [Drosophila hydei]